MNNFPENQDTLIKTNVLSGNSTSKGIFNRRKSLKSNLQKNFQKEFKGDWVYFKCFPEANFKQVDYYSIPMLVDDKSNATIILI